MPDEQEREQPYNAGNVEHVVKKVKAVRFREKRKAQALRNLMMSADGRLFMWDHLKGCGVYRMSMAYDNAGRTDPMQVAFNEGKRDRGNALVALINEVCPELFVMMCRENAEENS